MDYEIDSDLEEVSELELIEDSSIRPYLFEPTRNSVSDTENSDESSEETDDSSGEEQYGQPFADVSNWCQCGNCQNMPTALECKCCQTTNIVDGKIETEGIDCITEHEGFQVNCLNTHVLETSYYDHIIQNGPLQEGEMVHEVYRFIAYRRFTRWVYGLLGKRQRKVIPSCAVVAIRERFASEEYCGFKYPQ